MDREDARYQELEQLHERRIQVVRLHLRVTAAMKIVALTGLCHPTVRRTIDLFPTVAGQRLSPQQEDG